MIFERIKRFVSIYFNVKIQPPLEPILLQGHTLNKLKSILPSGLCNTSYSLSDMDQHFNFVCLDQMMYLIKTEGQTDGRTDRRTPTKVIRKAYMSLQPRCTKIRNKI